MKLFFLANPASAHTIKWVRALSRRGIDVVVYGISSCDRSIYKEYKNAQIFSLGINDSRLIRKEASLSKVRYLFALRKVREIIKDFHPDILHAHYASSYGILGALSNFHPFIISVWGSDVYSFPRLSFVHKTLLKYCLRHADKILSTSHVMAEETKRYVTKEIEVTPFGVDFSLFKKRQRNTLFEDSDLVVGTIKSLEKEYGIDSLMRAFKILKKEHPNLPLKLLIVGGGTLEESLRDLSVKLGIHESTTFTGPVPYDEVVEYYNMLSIYVAASNRESFGVSIIEASACERPVIVSNINGPSEVVKDGVTGFCVPPGNPEKIAETIKNLLFDKGLRMRIGQAARRRAKRLYNLEDNVNQMIDIYENILR